MTYTLKLSGLRELILELKKEGRLPVAILLSEKEARDLKQEMLDVDPLSRIGEHGPEDVPDNEALCFLDGVLIQPDKNVPTGRAWLLPPQTPDGRPLPTWGNRTVN